jgi:hypothetical protein
MGHMPGLANIVCDTIVMLKFLEVVRGTTPLLHHVGLTEWPYHFPLIRERHTSLISKQVISYWTCGGTCWPGGSTPKNRSLADSSRTNHKPWRSQPFPPFQTLFKPQHRTSPWSSHIMTDGRSILSTLNTSQTQHHKDGKTCMMTQDYLAKHN